TPAVTGSSPSRAFPTRSSWRFDVCSTRSNARAAGVEAPLVPKPRARSTKPAKKARQPAGPVRRGPAGPPRAAAGAAAPKEPSPSARASGAAPGRGRYVYCVIRSKKPLRLGLSTIAGEVNDVYTVNYKDLAAVVSDVPLGSLDSTRENVLAHEHV